MPEPMTVEDARGWNPDADWVEMEHPDVEGTAVVTRESLDEVHAANGWREVGSSGRSRRPAPSASSAASDVKEA